jgi:lysozyme
MKSSNDCLALIKSCEGFSAKPYLCPAGVPTIGYGSTRYADGRKVTLNDKSITVEQADEIMRTSLVEYENAVNRYVKVPITQGQFDALVDFAYNAGAQSLRNSTLLKMLNAGDYAGAAKQFERWVYADGKVLYGLVKRRKLEADLFLSKRQPGKL